MAELLISFLSDFPTKLDLESVFTKLNYNRRLNDFPNCFYNQLAVRSWAVFGSFCSIFLYRSKERITGSLFKLELVLKSGGK